MRNEDKKFNTIKRTFWQSFFGIKPVCPNCYYKMKRLMTPHEPGWECPNCDWLSWEDLT